MFLNTVKIFLVLVIFSSFFACKQNDKVALDRSLSTEQIEEVTLDGEFVKFYNSFHADSLFQLDHIVFPLKNYHQEGIGEFWTRLNWVKHKTFSDYGGMFKRDYQVVGNNLVIEKIIDANGFFNMERRFAKLSGGWNLIYYNVTNPGIKEGSN